MISKLSDFQVDETLHAAAPWSVCSATISSTSHPVRLTVFEQEISRQPGFRRAFKTDRGMLETLRHQSVVRFLGDGESDGRLFFWTEACESRSLASAIRDGRPLLVEDLIEIGWQVCSALQQAHNLGLSHGGISPDNILLSDNLQVCIADFGVHRWLKAAHVSEKGSNEGALQAASPPVSGSGWRKEVEKDLSDLATVLAGPVRRMIREATEAGIARPQGSGSLLRLLERMEQPNDLAQSVSARDMQGRLGELLIGGGDDEIPLLDQREQPAKSRRSIVDELFDPPAGNRHRQILPTEPASAETRWQTQILPIIVVLLLIIIVLLVAGLYR